MQIGEQLSDDCRSRLSGELFAALGERRSRLASSRERPLKREPPIAIDALARLRLI